MSCSSRKPVAVAALAIAVVTGMSGVGSASVARRDDTKFCAAWSLAYDAYLSGAPGTAQVSLFKKAAKLAPTKILRKDLKRIARYLSGASELSDRKFEKLAGVVGTATSIICDGELPE